MGIKEIIDDSKSRLDALLTYANGVTGADDSNIGDAVKTLADGFGGGGGAKVCEVIIQPTTNLGMTSDYVINHDLGVVPDLCYVYDTQMDVIPTENGLAWACILTALISPTNPQGHCGSAYIATTTGVVATQPNLPVPGSSTGGMHTLTDKSVNFRRASANGPMRVGRTYKAVFIKF